MISKKWVNRLLVTCITLMLTVTSIGGTYVSAVYAASVDEFGQKISEDEKADGGTMSIKKEDKILGGLLLVGLVSMLSKNGGDGKSDTSGAGKAVPSQTKPYIPPVKNTPVVKGNMSAEEMQLVSLINAERVKQGLAPLKANNQVGNVARAHSQDMADKGYFDHYDPAGKSPFNRLNDGGISYRAAGENIAINTSVPNAHNAFMNSPGHRSNVLESSYTEVGVGIIHEGTRLYVTENFIGK